MPQKISEVLWRLCPDRYLVAMLALKKKHSLEAELEKIAGTITTLESQVMTIENAHINLEVLGCPFFRSCK